MKAPAKSDTTLWLSRVSFFVSAVALVSVGYRSVSKRFLTDAEPQVAALSAAPVNVGLSNVSPLGFSPPSPETQVGAVALLETDTPDVPSAKHATVTETTVSATVNATVNAGKKLRDGIKAQAANLGVRVKRLVVTQAVEDREPVEVQEVSSSTPVIAFVEVATDGREDQNVVVTFEHETGDRVGLVNLNVPGNKSRWRTWGRTLDVNRDGRWTAVVRDSRGEELGRTEFTVRGTS